MIEVLCPIDNRPCPHLSMLEAHKDEPIPTWSWGSDQLDEETGEVVVSHFFNDWQQEGTPIHVQTRINTGRAEMPNWNPWEVIDSVRALAERPEIAVECRNRVEGCGVLKVVLGEVNG